MKDTWIALEQPDKQDILINLSLVRNVQKLPDRLVLWFDGQHTITLESTHGDWVGTVWDRIKAEVLPGLAKIEALSK